jgi:hypothetical protein
MAPPDQFSRHMAPKNASHSKTNSVNTVACANAGHIITHKWLVNKAVMLNSTHFCHFPKSMHVNDMNLSLTTSVLIASHIITTKRIFNE